VRTYRQVADGREASKSLARIESTRKEVIWTEEKKGWLDRQGGAPAGHPPKVTTSRRPVATDNLGSDGGARAKVLLGAML